MSYGQFLGDVGGTINPIIMREMFEESLRLRGQIVKLWHKPTIIDCPCVNPIYKSADPNCPICEGTGSTQGWSSEADKTFIAAVFVNSEIRQDQHAKLLTRIGPIETFDGKMFCEGRWYKQIFVDDHIVFKQVGEAAGIEMRVVAKSPRYGSQNEIIFIRCDLEKQPFQLQRDATDVKPLV